MFNRLRYDTCATKTELRDNVSIFSHAVDVNRFVHSDPCYHDKGVIAGNTTSTIGDQPAAGTVHKAWGEMVALENDLRGQTRPTSRCPERDYLPKKGVISNNPLHGPKQPDIRTDRKRDLQACQMIDYRNTDGSAYRGVEGHSDGTGAGAGK